MNKKNYPKWFYLVLFLIPVVIIMFLEIGLRFGGYGQNFEQWTEITDEEIILNPEIGARYFSNTKNFPHSNHDPFSKIKQNDTYRIFIFGGSSAAGFPFQPNGSFSRYLRDRLKNVLPDFNIEVVNLSITAVNTITIRDLLPGVMEKEPDLVIIYAGHNEFYGALGVGSTESLGNSFFIIDTYLYLINFRVTQLLKNLISYFIDLGKDESNPRLGNTLMARMAEEKSIELNSELYKKGVSQFNSNIDYILSNLEKEKIPTLIATLPSNLLDQKPFYSFDDDKAGSANHFYKIGREAFIEGDTVKAYSLLRNAKDLDGLRFRAPSEFNEIIKTKAEQYSHSVVDVEGTLTKLSKNKIIGNDLMVDHLHPTLYGQFIIGEAFFSAMVKNKLLKIENTAISESPNDSVIADFAFSKLDSLSAAFRIKNLLNDWPFKEKKNGQWHKSVSLPTKIDSIALKMVKQNLNWETAHQDAYKYYLNTGRIKKFIKEIKVITSQYPYKLTYYNYAAEELIMRKLFNDAEKFLLMRYKIEPDVFSTKWLGNINLYNGNFENAVNFLIESTELDRTDSQVYYNLAIAYLRLNKIENCVTALDNCLKLKPDHQKAEQLLREINKKAGL